MAQGACQRILSDTISIPSLNMASFSVQFHATPDELCEFVRKWASASNVYCAAVYYQPYKTSPVTSETVCAAIKGGAQRIVLAEKTIFLDAHGNNELLDRNPGLLILELGQLDNAGLGESHLSTAAATAAWKNIASSLRH